VCGVCGASEECDEIKQVYMCGARCVGVFVTLLCVGLGQFENEITSVDY
jgi:hypothetical protein